MTDEQWKDFTDGVLKNFFKGSHVKQCYCQAIFNLFFRPQNRSQSPNSFHGREKELGILKQLVEDKYCRLINLYGLYGIGKGSLVSEFVDGQKTRQEDCHWIDFDCDQAIEDFLMTLISRISRQNISDDLESKDYKFKIKLFFSLLKEKRHLIVLENKLIRDKPIEISNEYIDLFKDISRKKDGEFHQSCILLITCANIQASELESNGSVKTLQLTGVDPEAGFKILEEIFIREGIIIDRASAMQLLNSSTGHPLILRRVASEILSFDPTGNIQIFLEERRGVIANLSTSIDNIYQRQIDGLDKYCLKILELLLEESMRNSELELAFSNHEISFKDHYRKSIKTLENRLLLIKDGSIFSIDKVAKQFIPKYLLKNSHD